ncbi:8-oxo-dGTP pyrophosphatase MutT (NUDIX family) [Saccharopolyspora phatthalungensis]|uniref:8-oxo-dGTP pyrophosphatase MutT (NUDIX family) n=1 Tax=Saccharopolyspora phatthalungensis TaxID=664693 RepID=A0A840QEJ1_9PSEU|nr:8-oxo-dGTP pyrophosphatase MutT (NUDIX family) [Saccharopolyspora phatthalungensis]
MGGSVHPGENVLGALDREIEEETGWRLGRVLALLGRSTWNGNGEVHCELDFLVEVAGDLDAPRLEQDKHTEFSWIGPSEIGLLEENVARTGSAFIGEIVARAHEWLDRVPASRRRDITVTDPDGTRVLPDH